MKLEKFTTGGLRKNVGCSGLIEGLWEGQKISREPFGINSCEI